MNLYNNIKEALEVGEEIKPIDHYIERDSAYIPVRKGETDEEVLNHLEKLNGGYAVEPAEEVKESDVKLNADGVREDAIDTLVDGYKKSLQKSFDSIHTLQDLSYILHKISEEIDMRLYTEEDTNIQAMDIVKAFEKKSYKTMKDYQEALNDISAMEWDNKISKEAYEEYIARLQKAYNERNYR